MNQNDGQKTHGHGLATQNEPVRRTQCVGWNPQLTDLGSVNRNYDATRIKQNIANNSGLPSQACCVWQRVF